MFSTIMDGGGKTELGSIAKYILSHLILVRFVFVNTNKLLAFREVFIHTKKEDLL